MLFYIWKQLFIPLPYCTVVKLNYAASTHHITTVCAFLFIGLSQVNIWPLLQYAVFSEESIISYHKQRAKHEILLSKQHWILKSLL